MSLVLGVVGNDIGEVTLVTIPFKRLDLRAHLGHGTPQIQKLVALFTDYEQAKKAKKARFGWKSLPN